MTISAWKQVALLASAQYFSSECDSLKSRLNLENTTVYFSQFLPAGTPISVPDQDATCRMMGGGPRQGGPLPGGPLPAGPPPPAGPGPKAAVDLCRISAYTATSSRSGVNFETWLPINWTGRFVSHGNGGLSGCKFK
jgi:feruloyl esterase